MDELTQQLIQRALAQAPKPAIPLTGISPYNMEEDLRMGRTAPSGMTLRPMRPRDVGGIEALDRQEIARALQKAGAYPHGTYNPSLISPQRYDSAVNAGLRTSGEMMLEDLKRQEQERAAGLDPFQLFQPPRR